MKEQFPPKNTEISLEKEIDYCNKLIDSIKNNENLCNYPNISEKLHLLQETIDDDLEHLKTSLDEDAKIGHKTADTSFFGIKHILQ